MRATRCIQGKQKSLLFTVLHRITALVTKRLFIGELDVVADKGYYKSEEILTCDEENIALTLPKVATGNAKKHGRFDRQYLSLSQLGRATIQSAPSIVPAALHVLAYNLTRVINILGVKPVMAAMRQ